MTSYIYISRRPTVQEQFACYLARHPEIYAEFKRVCASLYERGIRRYSAFAVVGVVRYHHALQTGAEDMRVNNNLVPLFARKLMEEDVRFQGFFEIRKMRD